MYRNDIFLHVKASMRKHGILYIILYYPLAIYIFLTRFVKKHLKVYKYGVEKYVLVQG